MAGREGVLVRAAEKEGKAERASANLLTARPWRRATLGGTAKRLLLFNLEPTLDLERNVFVGDGRGVSHIGFGSALVEVAACRRSTVASGR